MITLKEAAAKSDRPETVFIMKKRTKYIGMRNGELVLTTDQGKAIVLFESENVQTFIDNMSVDTRNAKVIGKSVGIVPVYLN